MRGIGQEWTGEYKGKKGKSEEERKVRKERIGEGILPLQTYFLDAPLLSCYFQDLSQLDDVT